MNYISIEGFLVGGGFVFNKAKQHVHKRQIIGSIIKPTRVEGGKELSKFLSDLKEEVDHGEFNYYYINKFLDHDHIFISTKKFGVIKCISSHIDDSYSIVVSQEKIDAPKYTDIEKDARIRFSIFLCNLVEKIIKDGT